MRTENLQPAERAQPPSIVLEQIRDLAGPEGFRSYPVSNGSRRLTAIYGGGLAPRVVIVESVAAHGGVNFVREQYSFTHSSHSSSVSPDVAAYFFDPSDTLRELKLGTTTNEQADLIRRKEQELKDKDHQQRLQEYLMEAKSAVPIDFPLELLY